MHSYILLIVDQKNENHGTRTSNFRLLQAKEKNGYEKVEHLKKGQVFFVRGGRRGRGRKWVKIDLNRKRKLSSLNRDDEDVGLCAERQKFIVFSDGSCGVR